jgi:hypothetical protein
MTAVGYDTREEEGWDEELPRRPRRQFFNRRTAALAALITCALGFYGGVRVEKGQLASSASTSAGAGSTLPAGLRAGAGAAGATGRPGAAAGATGRPGGGNVSFGTVKSIDGKTIYVSDSWATRSKSHFLRSPKSARASQFRGSRCGPETRLSSRA